MKKHVLILGAGFGGLELATRLSETVPDAVRVTLLDRNDAFFFGFSKLEVMLGRQSAEEVKLYYRDIAKDGVEFRQETVTAIDATTRRVTTDAGRSDADFVVVALGADYDMAATPGFEVGGHEYTRSPAPSGFARRWPISTAGECSSPSSGNRSSARRPRSRGPSCFMSTSRSAGIRDSVQLSTTFPMQRPVPVTGAVSQMFRDGLAERGVEELSQRLVTGIDPTTRTAQLASGETLPYDLFVGIPVHRAPDVLAASGLAVNGWVPVDQDEPEDPVSRRLRPRRRLHRPEDRPQGGDLRGVGSARRRGRHRCRHHRRGASGALRGVRRLLRGVRRRTREQGRGQLPSGRGARGPAIRSVARVRPREGRVRRDPASTLVRLTPLRLARRAAASGAVSALAFESPLARIWIETMGPLALGSRSTRSRWRCGNSPDRHHRGKGSNGCL